MRLKFAGRSVGFGVGARAGYQTPAFAGRTACTSRTAARGPWRAPGEAGLDSGGRRVGLESTRRAGLPDPCARGKGPVYVSRAHPWAPADRKKRAEEAFRAGMASKKRLALASSNSSAPRSAGDRQFPSNVVRPQCVASFDLRAFPRPAGRAPARFAGNSHLQFGCASLPTGRARPGAPRQLCHSHNQAPARPRDAPAPPERPNQT